MRCRFTIFSYFVALFFVLSCSSDKKESIFENDDFSSPKSLFVDYISSVTSGIISRNQPIQIRLTKNLENLEIGQKLDDDLLSFSPSISGELTLIDARTLVFQPVTPLKSGQRYEATFALNDLLTDVPKDRGEFKFLFQPMPQNFEVEVNNIAPYSRDDLKKVFISGTLLTADYQENSEIEKMMTAKQGGAAKSISWIHEENRHTFKVEQVARTDNPTNVLLSIDGAAIGLDKEEEKEVEIPALGDFKVLSTNIVRGKENYIGVIFSDPLLERQNLQGMVRIEGAQNPRVRIDLNEIKVYPVSEINGSVQLIIDQGIKNSAGYALGENYQSALDFTQSKPLVRFADEGSGGILPSTNGLVLPFEAVGLKAVNVKVVRVFEDNVLQYLQVNQIGGSNQMSRVGRPVVDKDIPLNASGVTNLNEWNRFTLELSDIIKPEPGAVYQVIVGFNRSQSNYYCTDDESGGQIAQIEDNWLTDEESSYWDSYEYYYSPDYDWEERENPCSNSYYGGRRSIKKILFASDIGLIAKKSDKGDLHVYTTDIVTAKVRGGVDVSVYDYQQQVIGSGTTDSDGQLKISTDGVPYVIRAQHNGQSGYLRVDDGSALSFSNFNTTGSQIQNGLKGFLYGERGVWRPADTVHLALMIEDYKQKLPDNHPVILELYDPQNKLTIRKVSTKRVGDIYRFDLVTDQQALTGNWLAKALVGGATFYKTVKIETVKPNRLKIDLDFKKERLTALDETLSGDLTVRWLHGAKANGLKATYDLELKPVKTTFADYPNASFDDESKVFRSEPETIFEGRLDAEGKAKVNAAIDVEDRAPGALQAVFTGKVYEEGGDFSIHNKVIPYYPYKSFVGVQSPPGDKRGMLLTDKDHAIRIITVDANGKPVSRQNLQVELYKLNWRWWWDNSYDDISNYVGRSYRDPIQTARVSSTDGQAKWNLRINHPDWGRYYVRVKDPVSGHSAGQVVFVDWPGWAGKGQRGDVSGAAMLQVQTEKSDYKVGDQVKVSIPSMKGSKVLVSLETGSRIIQSYWVDTEEKNTVVQFEATPDMAPNVYVNMTMLQPHGSKQNDLPIRLYGVESINVSDPNTKLEPKVSLPAELKPEQQFTVEVSEASGKAMSYTLAMVDEGLLDLTNFKTPDPWPNFYAREALGVKTWDLYDDVIGAYGGKLERLLAIGGDDELKPVEEKEGNRFKPVVKFLGPYYLEAGRRKKHDITMPQYIGSVRFMVVAANQGAYGMFEKAVPVKQPMMILATLPRVAGPGEKMSLPVNVFVSNNSIKTVDVKVETSGKLQVTSAVSKTVRFNKAGDKVIYFDVEADKALGHGKVKVTATSGNIKASYDIDMDIIARNPLLTEITDKVLPNGEQWQVSYSPLGLATTNDAVLEFSTLPPLNIEKRLKYLIRYPHGCIEQTTSAVFVQLYLQELMDLPDTQKEQVQRNVTAGIERLSSFQLSNGGFAYWPGNTSANIWGTNYAGHFMIEAKNKGYFVPEGMLNSWVSYQRQRANSWRLEESDNDNALAQAYRLYALALAEQPELGAMNRMKELALPLAAQWRLALAYAVAGFEDEAEKMIADLSTEVSAASSRYTFGSRTRDEAMILETLVQLKKNDNAFNMVRKIAVRMSESDRWMSTQTTAYCFVAISKYVNAFPLSDKISLTVDADKQTTQLTSEMFVAQYRIQDVNRNQSISIQNESGGPVFSRLIRQGVPIEGAEANASKNLDMTVSYLDKNGNPLNVNQLKQGTDFKAQVTIRNPGLQGDYSELALTQLFPSGWEIINTRLNDETQEVPGADYVDIRDDRVMHYFDLKANKSVSFEVLLNAAYRGTYYLPAITSEAMYDDKVYSNKAGRWIQVVPE